MNAPSSGPADAHDATPLAWLVQRAALSDDAKAASASAADGDALLAALLDGGHVVDAVRLVASALPPREGVWWAWAAATHAARLTSGDVAPPPVQQALAATERWIAAPDEATRRAAWQCAQDAGMDTPAGSAAGAAFFTGGSIAPPDITPIPPPAGIHATMAFAAVIGSSAADTEHFESLARAFVAQGVEVIRQVGGWEGSIGHARSHHDAMQQQHLAVATPNGSGAPPST